MIKFLIISGVTDIQKNKFNNYLTAAGVEVLVAGTTAGLEVVPADGRTDI